MFFPSQVSFGGSRKVKPSDHFPCMLYGQCFELRVLDGAIEDMKL